MTRLKALHVHARDRDVFETRLRHGRQAIMEGGGTLTDIKIADKAPDELEYRALVFYEIDAGAAPIRAQD